MERSTTNPKKSTAKARVADAPVGALVPMPHGGALRNGGTNRGGPGRPPEAIRARSREMYEMILDEIESRKQELRTATLGELATLGNTTGRYGGLVTVEDNKTVSIGQLHLSALQATPYSPRIASTSETPSHSPSPLPSP
ncbi:MAG: hypothetical protein O2973_13245 [Gemmatimonadetes bacterium]|nr:hypothetical protein [Gemmatimonadota bacterium]